ncbi:probable disease resistance protein At4g33300 [Impatiens glandulifera]|uniref:probable disease resistance protein At4g33300 n=1 Tax=Impatiens glandulifera TaxID=253017 RepID=UPI001FB0BBF4|nr:probable disease resistance protein At4g33300 [Impatiens glandulifera]
MAVTDFFAGEIAFELLKKLLIISRRACLCKASAEQLAQAIQNLLPIIKEIMHSGVELPPQRQRQLDTISRRLLSASELADKVQQSGRWNVYRNLRYARKMEKIEKEISQFVNGPMQCHILADIHHTRFEISEMAERFDRIDHRLRGMKIGGVTDDVRKMDLDEHEMYESNYVNFGIEMKVAMRKVKEMILLRNDITVSGICGMPGCGKTTLARELRKEDEVKSSFNEILFLTVSQSPKVEELKSRIWTSIHGGPANARSQWNQISEFSIVNNKRVLVILDDVWSESVLQQLISCRNIPGCKFLVVSRIKFSQLFIDATYELKLLNQDESMSLFCHFAFGQTSIPLGTNQKLVKQVVDECKGLPLALKVIGSSLRDQPELIWTNAKNKLSRCQSIGESHENQLLERMKLSIDYLDFKVQECFMDLSCFPEDMRIPLDVFVNISIELHDIDKEEAFAILLELSNKNLITLVEETRSGESYSSYYDIFITQHDVLRDLAIHLTNKKDVNERKRLLMARRETELPNEWRRMKDEPFRARIVSLQTCEMKEHEWFNMDFPEAEVLILDLSSSDEYFLPPFIHNMPKLKSLIVINHGRKNTTINNLSVFTNMNNLRSLWFEKISIPKLLPPFEKLQKLSLILCNINNSLHHPNLFPNLSDLTIDHCNDFTELPITVCHLQRLESLSITNCHGLRELPSNLGRLGCSLRILRLYACASLKELPAGMGDLKRLEYVDISECVKVKSLPDDIGGMVRLEKIEMRQCPQIWNVPESAAALESLRRVICDEEISWMWRDLQNALPNLFVQVVQERFDLDWLLED